MKNITIEDILKLEPCEEGVAFLNEFSSPKEAWEACEDPQHLFWALRKLKLIPKETSVKLARIFAERAKKFAENADAANYAAWDAYAAARAAYFAAYAARAAYCASRAAWYTADAAYYAADAADADAAIKQEKIEQCRIIREHVNPFKG
jgi:hypothetical protein